MWILRAGYIWSNAVIRNISFKGEMNHRLGAFKRLRNLIVPILTWQIPKVRFHEIRYALTGAQKLQIGNHVHGFRHEVE